MSYLTAKKALEKLSMSHKILEFNSSTATVEEAASSIGCEPARIAKSLSLLVNEQPILIITAGDVKIDNTKYKNFFNVKAKMLPIEQVEELIGHQIGGVCPFGIKENVTVYLDESLKRFTTIFPACGSSNTAIELSLAELEKTANSNKWIDVCKPKE